MTEDDTQFEVDDLAELSTDDWEYEKVDRYEASFVNEDFPAQISVRYDPLDTEWYVSLYVFNPEREMMDLLSADYSYEFGATDETGVREQISALKEEVESGELDEYRAR